jgi:hypothetical protein
LPSVSVARRMPGRSKPGSDGLVKPFQVLKARRIVRIDVERVHETDGRRAPSAAVLLAATPPPHDPRRAAAASGHKLQRRSPRRWRGHRSRATPPGAAGTAIGVMWASLIVCSSLDIAQRRRSNRAPPSNRWAARSSVAPGDRTSAPTGHRAAAFDGCGVAGATDRRRQSHS